MASECRANKGVANKRIKSVPKAALVYPPKPKIGGTLYKSYRVKGPDVEKPNVKMHHVLKPHVKRHHPLKAPNKLQMSENL